MNKLPKKSLRFLRWFCPPELYESIEGDLLEQLEADRQKLGETMANWRLRWNVLRFFRPGIFLRNKLTADKVRNAMLQNHLKVSYRQLAKSRVSTAVNVLGLALGMAAAFLIFQYVSFEKSYENSHANAVNIYRVTTVWNQATVAGDERATTVPWSGPGPKEAFPEVQEYSRFAPLSVFTGDYSVEHDEVKLPGLATYFADPGFLKMFSFEILAGGGDNLLSEPFTAVLTSSNARKFFKDENPVGKFIRIDTHRNLGTEDDQGNQFLVTAVVQDPPANSHLSFDVLLSYSSIFPGLSNGSTYWHWDYTYCYLMLQPGANTAELEQKISNLRVSLFGEEMTYYTDAINFRLQPITDIHLHSSLKNELGVNGDGRAVFFLQLVMIGILLSAYVNYINLSTVKAIERKREIGVRKIIGSTRSQLAGQLLVESVLVNVLAVGMALLLVAASIPVIENAFGVKWPSLTGDFLSYTFLLSALGVLTGGILLSVLYPVFVLTSFKPIEVLKGSAIPPKTGIGKVLNFRTALIVMQFVFCIAFTTGTWTLFRQLQFMKNYNLGMNPNQVLVVQGYGFQSPGVYETFKNHLTGLSFVESVGFSSAAPGDEVNLLGLKANVTIGEQTEPKELKIVAVDGDFFRSLEVQLLAGQAFDPARANVKTAMLNEAAVKLLNAGSPDELVGQALHNLEEGDCRIIGVIKNYNQLSLRDYYEPIVYVPYKEWDRSWNKRYFFVKIKDASTGDRYQHALNEAEAAWKAAAPDKPFQYFFLDNRFESQYKAEAEFSSLFMFFSAFAIVISCLGLFGLVAYSTIQRTREIGIRKVLGATVENILALLSKDFVRLIMVATTVALPLVWFGLEQWLATYAFRIKVDLWLFAAPVFCVFVLSLGTVVLRSWRVAVSNPVESLRNE